MRLDFHALAEVAVCATLLGPVQPAPDIAGAQTPDSLRLNATYGFVRSWNLAASLIAVKTDNLDARYDFQDYSCAYRLSFIIMGCLKTAEAELQPIKDTLDAALAEAVPSSEVNQLATWCVEELQTAEKRRLELLKAFQKLEKEEAEYQSDKDPYDAGDSMVGTIAYSLDESFPIAGLIERAKALVTATALTDQGPSSNQVSLRLWMAESYAAGYALSFALTQAQNAAEIILGNAEDFCVWTEISLAQDLLDQAISELLSVNEFMTGAEGVMIKDPASLELAVNCLTNVEAATQRRASLLQSWEAMHEASEERHTKGMLGGVLEKLKSKCDVAPALKKSKLLVQKMKAL